MAAAGPFPPGLCWLLLSLAAWGADSCPAPCSCPTGSDEIQILDCNKKRLSVAPFGSPPGITHLTMNHNELTAVPLLGDVTSNITSLLLVHNRISELWLEQLQPYTSLETLDLTSNSISELRAGTFPPMQLKYLNLSNNKLISLEAGCFDNISSTLLVLRLNRNRISLLPAKVFRLPQLQILELKRNRLKMVDSLTFKGLDALRALRMQRNALARLMDGAFFGLNNMEELELEHNNLTEVNKGWLYGLRMMRVLRVDHNAISIIRPDAWEFCQRLEELDLSSNHLTRLEEAALAGLGVLERLDLRDNAIRHLGEGVFSSLANLRSLDMGNNEVSWAIEDSMGMFVGMKRLNTLILQRNKIKSITKNAFQGLDELQHLDLSKNDIMSVHPESLRHLNLRQLVLNSSSLLCDCQLRWLSPWLREHDFDPPVMAVCAHPPPLRGRTLPSLPPDHLLCDRFPQPRITEHPGTLVSLRGSNVTLSCGAASSSDAPMAAAWRKDGEVLYHGLVDTYASYQQGELTYTTLLHLLQVNFTDQGRYQCIVSNHFGSNYSSRAALTVNELPSFLKTPMDLVIRAGTMARLECAAQGHPPPQIAWQKDGGSDFPAARERRMHVMPDDDIFFIASVKTEDMGVYSCTAQNAAGSLSANATLTVLETPSFLRPLEDRVVSHGETAVLQCIAGGSPAPRLNWTKDDGPLVLTERHFFAAANQLLIIVEAGPADAGKYTCVLWNPLGTERGHIYLGVAPGPSCDPGGGSGDGWATVGIVVMVVVGCVVGTSLLWVIVIYHMRRRSQDYSITNTDEMTLPADSYLSSQGTLAEPPEGYSSSEAGSHQQLMPPLAHAYSHKGSDAGGAGPLVMCSDCYDSANVYSRTREFFPYAYLADQPSHGDPAPLHPHDPSLFLTSHSPPSPPTDHFSQDPSSRSFWGEGEEQQSVHTPPRVSSAGEGGGRPPRDHRPASYRTNPQEHPAPT